METAKKIGVEQYSEAMSCLKVNDPFFELEWVEGDWSVYRRRLLWSYTYYVSHKSKIVQRAPSLLGALMWIESYGNRQTES